MAMTSEHQAAAMDRMYRMQRHIYDATRRYYLLGRDLLVRDLGIPPGGSVLEVGCGTGRNLVKVAESYPAAMVYGFDISGEILKSARAAASRISGTPRIHLAQGDALNFDPAKSFGIARFDRVFLSYTLSMIPNWKDALQQAMGMLSPCGELHVADFGQCENLPVFLKTALVAWLGQFGVTPRSALPQTMETLAAAQGRTVRFTSCHRGYSWRLVARP